MRSRPFATTVVGLLFVAAPLMADHRLPAHQHSSGQQILGLAARALPHVFGTGHHHHHSHAGYSYRSIYRSYDYPSYSYSYYPYSTYYEPRANYIEYYLPPVYYPAELVYGPQAMKSFMGLDRDFALRPVVPPVDPAPATKDAPRPPESSPAALSRARKFVGFGDYLFKEGKYHEALQQYKSANKVALDYGAAFFRQGFALAATSRFELAADAFRRGLTLDPDYAASDFRLDEIYGAAHLAKATHLEALAATALDRPDDADMLFVLGVYLHYAESPARAKKFFERAAELSRPGAAHLRPFLEERAPKADAAKEAGVDA